MTRGLGALALMVAGVALGRLARPAEWQQDIAPGLRCALIAHQLVRGFLVAQVALALMRVSHGLIYLLSPPTKLHLRMSGQPLE